LGIPLLEWNAVMDLDEAEGKWDDFGDGPT
jgi:hypothetical protein